ncbi:hypothetical protein ROS1_56940 [Roseibium sp. ROS1]
MPNGHSSGLYCCQAKHVPVLKSGATDRLSMLCSLRREWLAEDVSKTVPADDLRAALFFRLA